MISEADLRALVDLADRRGVRLLCDDLPRDDLRTDAAGGGKPVGPGDQRLVAFESLRHPRHRAASAGSPAATRG